MFWQIIQLMLLTVASVPSASQRNRIDWSVISLSTLLCTCSNSSTMLLLIQSCHPPNNPKLILQMCGFQTFFRSFLRQTSLCFPLPKFSDLSFSSQFPKHVAWTTVICQMSHREIWGYDWIVRLSVRFWYRVSSLKIDSALDRIKKTRFVSC